MAVEEPNPAARSRKMRKRVDVIHEILKRKVLTIPEVSEYLRVSRQTIYRMLKRGDIPAFRIGGDWRFTIEELGHLIGKESPAAHSRRSPKQQKTFFFFPTFMPFRPL